MTSARVSEEVLAELKEQVLWKHGKLRGALRDEIDAAVRQRSRELKEERNEAEGPGA
jgi:hypothetical protein